MVSTIIYYVSNTDRIAFKNIFDVSLVLFQTTLDGYSVYHFIRVLSI